MSWVGGSELWYCQDPQMGELLQLQSSAQGVRGLSPHVGLPILGVLCQEHVPPRTFGFDGQQGLLSEPRGLWGIETSPLNGSHKISHATGPGAEAVI